MRLLGQSTQHSHLHPVPDESDDLAVELQSHGPKLGTTRARGFVGWAKPTIRPGIVVDCTHAALKILTKSWPMSHSSAGP